MAGCEYDEGENYGDFFNDLIFVMWSIIISFFGMSLMGDGLKAGSR